MIETGTLETMAEIGIALTGFTGVVSVLEDRPRVGWAGPDRVLLVALLIWSLIAAIFGVLPGVLVKAGLEPHQTWRLATLIFAVVNCSTLSWFVSAVLGVGLGEFRSFERWSIRIGVPGAVLLTIFQITSVFGPVSSSAPLVYHLSVFWFLGVAALAFSFMLFPRDAA